MIHVAIQFCSARLAGSQLRVFGLSWCWAAVVGYNRSIPPQRAALFVAKRESCGRGIHCDRDEHRETGPQHLLQVTEAKEKGRNVMGHSLLPIEMLFTVVTPLIATAPCVTRIAAVYGNMPRDLDEALNTTRLLPCSDYRDTHRWLRRHFGTLVFGLRWLQATNATEHWGIYVSEDGVYTVKAHSAEEAEKAFADVCGRRGFSDASECASSPHTSLFGTESLLEVFQPVFPCFTPPPPFQEQQQQRQRSMGGKRKGHVPSGMFTPQMLVPFIPTFFIPMSALLSSMPEGYTADHVERLFAATGVLEVVTLEGEQFVRLHGGNRLVDFASDNAEMEAQKRWKEYQPDPFLCASFRQLLLTSSRWTPLRALITGAPAALVHALLPWRNYKTILYFSQMQHVFGFTSEGEGAVSWLSQVTCLSYHDSPTPAVVSELMGKLAGQRVCIADFQSSPNRVSEYAKTQIIMYYGTLSDFFRVHGEIFYMDEEEGDTLVGLVSDKAIARRTTRKLEDRLEDALLKKDRRTAQKVRRRIALEKEPDNPYADREVLLDAILRYVPRARSISLAFLLKTLPPSLSDFLPGKPLAMFQQAPEKVVLFEYRYRHRLHIVRHGVPLPPGALRQNYTEQELLFLCAAELRQQPRCAIDVYGRLPYGAKEIIRLQYKGLLELLRPYPQYFAVVFKSGLHMDTRFAMVTLLQMPPPVQLSEVEYGAIGPDNAAQKQQLETEDIEAMKTLPEEIQKTLRLD